MQHVVSSMHDLNNAAVLWMPIRLHANDAPAVHNMRCRGTVLMHTAERSLEVDLTMLMVQVMVPLLVPEGMQPSTSGRNSGTGYY